MEYTKSFLKNHLKVMVTNSDLYVYGGRVVRKDSLAGKMRATYGTTAGLPFS